MNNISFYLEKTAKDYPNKIAIEDEKSKITYENLVKKSKSVATYILSKNIKPNNIAAFYMLKSVKSLVGMMGCAYSRLCYSFIDIGQPLLRKKKVLDIIKPKIIFTDKENKEKAMKDLSEYSADIVCIEDIWSNFIDENLINNSKKNFLDTDLLYINFTSGSTGVPKGVVISHGNIIKFINKFVKIFDINPSNIMGNQAPFDFDVSAKDIYSTIFTGATCVIIPTRYFSFPTKLIDYIIERKVDTLIWAVSALCLLSGMRGFEHKVPEKIKKVFFSGEKLPIKHLNIWRKYLPDAIYINLYGPTEITCNCTYYVLENIDYKDIPIGTAFPNEKVFLLDEEDKLIEKNSEKIGQIVVGGETLAYGYYKDMKKTGEVFIQNPLNNKYYERVYKTGDLAKYGKDGNLYYIGRKDFQIKHMGHRIELEEIEKASLEIDEILNSCAIYDFKNSKINLFYCGSIEKAELLNILKNSLPHYMIPAKIFKLESMPINKNGKRDRKALKKIGGISD